MSSLRIECGAACAAPQPRIEQISANLATRTSRLCETLCMWSLPLLGPPVKLLSQVRTGARGGTGSFICIIGAWFGAVVCGLRLAHGAVKAVTDSPNPIAPRAWGRG